MGRSASLRRYIPNNPAALCAKRMQAGTVSYMFRQFSDMISDAVRKKVEGEIHVKIVLFNSILLAHRK